MKTVYIASFKYGEVSLEMIEFERETPKLYRGVTSHAILLGHQVTYTDQVHKSNRNIFSDLSEALQYLINKVEKHANKLREDLEKTQTTLVALRTLVAQKDDDT